MSEKGNLSMHGCEPECAQCTNAALLYTACHLLPSHLNFSMHFSCLSTHRSSSRYGNIATLPLASPTYSPLHFGSNSKPLDLGVLTHILETWTILSMPNGFFKQHLVKLLYWGQGRRNRGQRSGIVRDGRERLGAISGVSQWAATQLIRADRASSGR